jgi:phosphoesterase RecJ-like protein
MKARSETNPQEDAVLQSLLALVRSQPRWIVTSHARPDGDAIGSSLAMAQILDQLGREVEVVLADPVPDIYLTLPQVDRIRHSLYDQPAAIVLECDSIDRTGLPDLAGRLLVNIDHHSSGREYAAFNWIDPQASAVAEMVYRVALAARIEITPAIATCLYTALLSDTRAFTYPLTTATTFELAHTLTLKGANPSRIARDIFFSAPLSKIKLLGTALSNLDCQDTIAWSYVTQVDLDRAKATPEDSEGIVNHLIRIAGVESAVFFRELPKTGQYRLSIRSKGRVDVAAVAEFFGGGGHRTASGCTVDGPLPSAIQRVVAQLRSASVDPSPTNLP